ncbi:Uncharacterized protein QTN25_002055 [Entamoeba marina]
MYRTIKNDLRDIKGNEYTTIEISLAVSLLDNFKRVELSTSALQQLKQIIVTLKPITQKFTTATIRDIDDFQVVHQELLVQVQQVVGILEEDIAKLEGDLSSIKSPSIKEKVIEMTLEQMNEL